MIVKRSFFGWISCVTALAACSGKLYVTKGSAADGADSGMAPGPDGMPGSAEKPSSCGQYPSPCYRTLVQCSCQKGPLHLVCGVNAGAGTRGLYVDSTASVAALDLCDDRGCDAARWDGNSGLLEPLVSSADVAGIAGFFGTTLYYRSVLVNRLPDAEDHRPLLFADGHAVNLPLVSAVTLTNDGSTVLGILPGPTGQFARWTAAKGISALGSSSAFYSGTPLMTMDGNIVVGVRDDTSHSTLVRWSADGTEVPLGAFPDGTSNALLTAMSSDGSVVAGIAVTPGSTGEVFRWTEANGMATLALKSAGTPRLTADGATLFGTYLEPEGATFRRAFRWTEATGVVPLDGAPGESVLLAINPAGDVAVGYSIDAGRRSAFVWTASRGIRLLESVLQAAGAELQGWELGTAIAISADGKVVIGDGKCGGVDAIFLVGLPR